MNSDQSQPDLCVRLSPGSGLALTDDWWVAAEQTFGISVSAFGYDATIATLMRELLSSARHALDRPASTAEAELAEAVVAAHQHGLLARLIATSAYLESRTPYKAA